MAQGAPAQRHDLVRPHQLLRDRAHGRRRAGAVARGRPARSPPRRRDPGEPRQPARRRQGGEAPALRQPALRQRPHRRLRRGLPGGPPLPPPDDRLDGGPRRREPRRRARFFRAHYGPDNTVLTLCGDLTARARVRPRRALLRRPGRERRAAPARPPAARPARARRCASSAARSCPTTGCTSRSACPSTRPTSSSPRAVALDCIGGLATSRLVRRLVRREQTALGAHATAWGFVDGASLGFVVLDVAPGTDPAEVEAAFVEELEGFLEHGPTDDRARGLARAVRAVLALGARQPGGARRPDQPPPPAPRRPRRRQHPPRPAARRHRRAGASTPPAAGCGRTAEPSSPTSSPTTRDRCRASDTTEDVA